MAAGIWYNHETGHSVRGTERNKLCVDFVFTCEKHVRLAILCPDFCVHSYCTNLWFSGNFCIREAPDSSYALSKARQRHASTFAFRVITQAFLDDRRVYQHWAKLLNQVSSRAALHDDRCISCTTVEAKI